MRKFLSTVLALAITISSFTGLYHSHSHFSSLHAEGVDTADENTETVPGDDAAETTTVLGDCNGDGVVNSKDIITLKLCISGDSALDLSLADVNRDGVVDATDINAIANNILVQDRASYEYDYECKHSYFFPSQVSLPAAETGACGDVLLELSLCKCGKFCNDETYLLPDNGNCEFEIIRNNDINNEDTSAYVCRCINCGLTLEFGYTYSDAVNCVRTKTAVYKITLGSKEIRSGSYEITEESHNTEDEYVSLYELGACGGIACITKCADCSKVTYFTTDMNIDCDFTYETKEILGFDGYVHTVSSSVCRNCGIVYSDEEWSTALDRKCYRQNCTVNSVSMNGVTVATMFSTDEVKACTPEDKYTLNGNTCADGWTFESTCKRCGDAVENEETEGGINLHPETTYETKDLTQYGVCGGTAEFGTCKLCGEYCYISDPTCEEEGACVYEYAEESTIDTDGNEHYIYTLSCATCGLKYSNDTWEAMDAECTLIYHSKYTLYVGTELISESENRYEESHCHSFTETYELKTPDTQCDSGWICTSVCERCGYTSRCEGNTHMTAYNSTPLDVYGVCGSEYCENVCEICGYGESYLAPISCLLIESKNETTVDENGIEHTVIESQCHFCDMTVKTDRYTKNIGPCQKEITENSVYNIIGYTFNTTKTINSESHYFEYTYMMSNDNCESGWICFEQCQNCDYSEAQYGSGHTSRAEYIDISESGACAGQAEKDICDICNNICYFDFDPKAGCPNANVSYGTNESDHGYTQYTCPDCGLVYIKEYWYTKDTACRSTYNLRHSITVNGAAIVDITIVTPQGIDHSWNENYTITGTTCEEGWTLNRVCTDCGVTESTTGDYHVTEYVTVPLDVHGACAGSYCNEVICKLCNDIFSFSYDPIWYCTNVEYTSVTDDSTGITTDTYICPDCGVKYIYTQRTETDPETEEEITVFETHKLYIGEKLIEECEFSYQDIKE